jgi:prepilin-type N-terminal cleavage/methylation domain-containing protein
MRKADNRGFSLIELLIAVTIFAVVVVPLLHTFVTATTTNSKAKRILEATTAGENLFEELKASSVETLMETPDEATVSQDAEGNELSVLKKSFDRKVNGVDYHMVMTLDPTAYATSPEAQASDADADSATDYNSLTYAQLENLSPSDNALLLMSPSDVDSAVNELLLLEPASGIPGRSETEDRSAAIRANLKRSITVRIQNNGTFTVVTATVIYTDGSYSYPAMDEYEIYNNSLQTDNVLSNVFICFYPMYNNTGTTPTETITVENTGNYKPGANNPLKVYLVKQTGRDEEADAVTKSTYAVDVQIKEGGGSAPVTELATNLKYSAGGAGDEMRLSYTGSTLPAGTTLQSALHVTAGEEGLWHADAGNRIYDVTIEVYRQKKDGNDYGTEDLLTTITGTKIE